MNKKRPKIVIPVAEKKTEEMKANDKILQNSNKPKIKARAKAKSADEKKIKIQSNNPQKTPTRKKSILFVCSGNTCRSAMAQFIMQSYLIKNFKSDKICVDSAGVAARNGDDMPSSAKKALEKLGIPYNAHSSKILTDDLVDNADLIVCMTMYHKGVIRYDEKCRTIREIAGGADVADPYGEDEGVYQKTAEHLYYVMEDIVDYLENKMI